MADSGSMPFTPLPSEVEESLAEGNPWWQGGRTFELPKLRRWLFASIRNALDHGLAPA